MTCWLHLRLRRASPRSLRVRAAFSSRACHMRLNSLADVPGRFSAWMSMFMTTRSFIWARVTLKLEPGVSTWILLWCGLLVPLVS